ncbi:hypothetical protein L914_11807 [Phytophthora nicotianae]|uniref:Uncharacterized protein n=1 Tax=Phytophthora nicotianae TaxID=4792 RepID=W2N4B2_PHYNI|nr:hypothetical protein L914_11807 [Phytophthora nicotianae]
MSNSPYTDKFTGIALVAQRHWPESELSYRPVDTPHYWRVALGAWRRSREPM